MKRLRQLLTRRRPEPVGLTFHMGVDTKQLAAAVTRAAIKSQEINMLARYNAEVSRGIVHTPEWTARMAELQQRHDTT